MNLRRSKNLNFWFWRRKFNCSDGRMVRASAPGGVDLGVIPSRVKPMTLKLVFTASLLDLSINGTEWRTSRQVYLLCRWDRHLAGFPHLGEVDRWPATPKRARIAHWSLSLDRRINMQQNIKMQDLTAVLVQIYVVVLQLFGLNSLQKCNIAAAVMY